MQYERENKDNKSSNEIKQNKKYLFKWKEEKLRKLASSEGQKNQTCLICCSPSDFMWIVSDFLTAVGLIVLLVPF